ncbi:MAG: acyl-CoA carboxylase biotin carboxyl carrier protein subunit [Candidatus Limnocylindria bacterium]
MRAGDRDLAIEVTPEGRFLVGDQVAAADLAETVPGRVWSVVIDGAAHEVAFLGGDRVWVDGDEIRLDIADERAVAAGRAGGRAAYARQEVRAPMPGLLKRVHVAEGEKVSAGDALVTLEAMKMENELRAPQAGTIVQVAVAEGTKVEGGALLIVIRSQ